MSDEKKIIVDENWKSQVAAEKDAMKHETDSEKGTAAKPPTADAAAMPGASFSMLLTTLATEAMMALGQMPLPGTQERQVNLSEAKYIIDMLEMLTEKTKNNLLAVEEDALKDILHQLRMMFVSIQSSQTPGTPPATPSESSPEQS